MRKLFDRRDACVLEDARDVFSLTVEVVVFLDKVELFSLFRRGGGGRREEEAVDRWVLDTDTALLASSWTIDLVFVGGTYAEYG